MPRIVRVGRSAFFSSFLFSQRDFVGKIGGKSGLQHTKQNKHCENSVFLGDFCFTKYLLGSGPFSRDGRVTGNKHILFRP